MIGLNQGLLIGIGCAVVSFVLSYASESMHTMQRVYKRSRVVRPASQRRVLAIHRDKILCMEVYNIYKTDPIRCYDRCHTAVH
jgi:hypothetical protein